MTTELEKQFFDTFEIPKTCQRGRVSCKQYNRGCDKCCYFDYSQIISDILLGLICIDYTENPYKCRGYVSNAQELKNYLLGQFIHEFENDLYRDKEDIKQQVQALFKE